MSYYVHHVPGRLRVKTPFIKKDPLVAGQIEKLLTSMPGITSVIANQLTGSVVVNFDSTILDPQRILDVLKLNGYFDPSKAVTSEQYIEEGLSKTSNLVGKALLGFFLEKAFEGSPLALLSVII